MTQEGQKECEACRRILPRQRFLYRQTPDGLDSRCRSCRSLKSGTPTTEQVLEFETQLEEILREGIRQLIRTYRRGDVEQLCWRHRGELEQLCWNGMRARGLLEKWKPPVWINPSSLRD
jgi:hypothetical protein